MKSNQLFVFIIFFIIVLKTEFIYSNGDFCLHPKSNNFNQEDININLKTSTDVILNIKFIKNAKQNCINPYFPIILINTSTPHDGWIQIVYTNSDDESLRKFIDYDPNFTKSPFYSHTQYFYDAPLWSLFPKKTLLWKAHVFTVRINHDNKTIQSLGGIEWGFKLQSDSLPITLPIKLLNKNEWQNTWNFIKDKLIEYKNIEHND